MLEALCLNSQISCFSSFSYYCSKSLVLFSCPPVSLIKLRLNDEDLLRNNFSEPPVLVQCIFNSWLEGISFGAHVLNIITWVDSRLDLIGSQSQRSNFGFFRQRGWLRLWLWLWLWFWWLNSLCSIWKNLLHWQRSLPNDSNRSPEALSIDSNKAESLKCHRTIIIVKTGVHELVRWDPSRVCTNMFPHVEVILCFMSHVLSSFLDSSCVHVATVKESTTGGGLCELRTTRRTSTNTWISEIASIHELWSWWWWCYHIES